MNEDGRMARLKDLYKFSKKHKLQIASIENLIAYRLRNENLIKKISIKNLFSRIKNEKYDLITYENKLNNLKNFVIKKGNFNINKSVRVRVVSTSIKKTMNIFKDIKVARSIKYLSNYTNFILIVINNINQKKIESDSAILRYYGIGAQIIKDLKVRNMILVTRTRKKLLGLEGFGLKIKKQEIIK